MAAAHIVRASFNDEIGELVIMAREVGELLQCSAP